MRDVYLHGHLGEAAGYHHRLDVKTPREAMWAIDVRTNGKLFNAIKRDGYYRIVHGADLESGDDLKVEQVGMNFRHGDFHFCPVAEGSGGSRGAKGAITAVIGVVLIIVSYGYAAGPVAAGWGAIYEGAAVTWANVAMLGVSLALSGVSQMIAASQITDSYDKREKDDSRKTNVFNGPVNTVEEGSCIPVVFGRHWIGSTVVSAGLRAVNVDIPKQQLFFNGLFPTNVESTCSIVLGTDGHDYVCILKHVSEALAPYNSRPITGANWTKYWQARFYEDAEYTTGTTWRPRTFYTCNYNANA